MKLGSSLKVLLAIALVWQVATEVPVFAQNESPDGTRQYSIAARLQNLESYDLATEEWERFLDQYPNDPRVDEATHYLGVCYLLGGNLEKALTTFQKVISTYPKLETLDATYLNLSAAQYNIAQSGKPDFYDKAAETLDTLLRKYPQSDYVPDALFRRGDCFYMRKKLDKAVEAFQRLVDNYPNHRLRPRALYALGVAQQESGQHDVARQTYDVFLQHFSVHELAADVDMLRGECFYATGDYDEAGARFQTVAAIPGCHLADWAIVRHGDALAQTGKYKEAALLYVSLPTRFPESEHLTHARLAAGECYYLAGDSTEARKQLKPLLDGKGETAVKAAHWTARSLLKENKPAEALNVVERVLPRAASTPLAAQLLMDRADAIYEIPERRDESIGVYTEIATRHAKDPVAPEALYMAGFAALHSSQYQLALKHATAFLSAYADNKFVPNVMEVAAESNLVLKDYVKAEKEYGKLIEKYPDRADAGRWKIRQARAFQLQKKHAETIAAIEPVASQLREPALIAEARHVIGTSQLEQQQYDQAAQSLEASLAADPNWRCADETSLALAKALCSKDQLDEAKSCLSTLAQRFPQSRILDEVYYLLGEYNSETGDYQAAGEAYQTMMDRWPASPFVPHALHNLGCIRLDEEKGEAAEKALSQLIEQYPDHSRTPLGRYDRGLARFQLAKYAPAMDDFKAVLAPGSPGDDKSNARYMLGLCQTELKQYDQAAASFRSLLREDPKYSQADLVHYQMAWVLELQGKDEDAVKVFTKLTQAFPKSSYVAEAYSHIGDDAYEKKDYTAASKAYYETMQKAGKSELGERAGHKLGWSYYHQKNYPSAQKTFAYQRKTYPQGPLGPDAAFMEAECLFQQEKFPEALAAYEQIQGLKSDDFKVLSLLHAGQAAGQLGEWQKSLDLLSTCTTEYPESSYLSEAFYEQGWAQQNLGGFDEALALFNKAITASGEAGGEAAARAQFMIGEVQFDRKEHSEAVRSFFKVILGYSYPKWQAEATYEAARCFEVLKKPTQAVRLYQELVEKYPQSDKVPLAKQRIEQLQG